MQLTKMFKKGESKSGQSSFRYISIFIPLFEKLDISKDLIWHRLVLTWSRTSMQSSGRPRCWHRWGERRFMMMIMMLVMIGMTMAMMITMTTTSTRRSKMILCRALFSLSISSSSRSGKSSSSSLESSSRSPSSLFFFQISSSYNLRLGRFYKYLS